MLAIVSVIRNTRVNAIKRAAWFFFKALDVITRKDDEPVFKKVSIRLIYAGVYTTVMKWVFLLGLVVLAGCVVINEAPAPTAPAPDNEPDVIRLPPEAELVACTSDVDCIPNPGQCHPDNCINRKHDDLFEVPQACTREFRIEAAYNAQDCGCVNNVCTNLNEGKDQAEPEDTTPPRVPVEGDLEQFDCTEEARDADLCPALYDPVCGWFDSSVNCLVYPCAQTYSNNCEACRVSHVEYYTLDECPTG